MKNYTYKDVLLGLRYEYLRNIQKLQKLKQYSKNLNDKVNEYYYWVHKWHKDINPEIICHIKSEQKEINIKINEVQNNIDIINFYLGKSPYFQQIRESINDKEEFNKTISEILSSEFANSMYESYISLFCAENTFGLSITPNIIDLYLKKGIFVGSSCTYLSSFDSLCLHTKNESSKDVLEYMLGIEIPKSLFNKYIQNTIENNINDKKIVLLDDTRDGTIKLSIVEDDKTLVLRRK